MQSQSVGVRQGDPCSLALGWGRGRKFAGARRTFWRPAAVMRGPQVTPGSEPLPTLS